MPQNPLINSLLRQNPASRTVLNVPEEEDDLAVEDFLGGGQPTASRGSAFTPRPPSYTTPTNPTGDLDTFNERAKWAGTHESAQGLTNSLNSRPVPAESTEERLFKAMRSGADPGELSALQFLLGREDQVAGRNATLEAQTRAKLGGFSSPQEMAGWGRDLEEAKVLSPLNVARTTGQFGLDEARVRGETAVNQARTQGEYGLKREGLIQDTKRQGFDALGNMFGGEADGRSRSMSIPGVGAMSQGAERPDAQVPAQLQTNLMNARRLFAQRPNDPAAKATLDSAIANLVNATPASETSKQWAHTIATNPQLSAMPLEQIISLHEKQTGDVLEAEEVMELRNLMSQILAGQQIQK